MKDQRTAREDALYADEPWAKLAVELGFRPHDTDRSFRWVFERCAERIAGLEERIAELEAKF